MAKKTNESQKTLEKNLEYIGLNLNKIPTFLKAHEVLNFRPSKTYDDTVYKVYKYVNIKDIDILITPSDRLTDIKETQDIQIYNADKTRKELISRFFSDTQTEELLKLTYDFPFNNYKTEDIEKALNLFIQNEKSRKKYKEDLIEEVINNLEEGRFKF